MSAIATKLITAEEFMNMPEPADGSKQDLVRGEIVTMPSPKGMHGIIQSKVDRLIGNFVDEHRLGWTVTESGVILERDPDTVRGPDVAFYSIQRQPNPPEDYFEVPPDLAVEIRSPSDRPGRIREKIRDYVANGVRLIWVVDPADRTVTVYAGRNRGVVYDESDTLDCGDVLPGFSCQVSQFFV
jgi:Uma2 family endonuclease